MKNILRLGRSSRPDIPPAEAADSVFFSTAFAAHGVDPGKLVHWDARAAELGSRRMRSSQGGKLLQHLWAADKTMALLGDEALQRLEPFLAFFHVDAKLDLIRQDEYGNFMVVLLTGTIGVDRLQPWGEQTRLAQVLPGDIVGEMSLLDSGVRFSSCVTLTECDIAVLDAAGLDAMMLKDPQLAASLVALLARKLSLRLRAVSARLSDQQH